MRDAIGPADPARMGKARHLHGGLHPATLLRPLDRDVPRLALSRHGRAVAPPVADDGEAVAGDRGRENPEMRRR
ncbi:hypothetical protein AB5I41_04295 [Sphingomonas sp. MMS24-JH45]